MTPTATPLETIALSAPGPAGSPSGARAWIAPRRGALVTRFTVGERQVLFLDEATLLDEKKNVRGGVPILFPSPGKLAGDRWARGGRSGALGQHGFARSLPWEVVTQGPAEAALSLLSSAETRANFPWEFRLDFRFALRVAPTGAVLRIEQRMHNPGAEALPFGCGFHPYFFVPQAEKAGARIVTGATRAFDNAGKREVSLNGPIDLTAAEVDLHLEDHASSRATLALADGARVEVSGSLELQRWVVWTLAGKEFVCLEPWSGPADGLNTGAGLLEVAAGGTRELWTEIAFHAPPG